MMEINNWHINITEDSYNEMLMYVNNNVFDGYEYHGAIRKGECCFDICGEYGSGKIWFDLYVGGIDDGYAYSTKIKDYPYAYIDDCSFCIEPDDMKFEKFIQTAIKRAEEIFKIEKVTYYDKNKNKSITVTLSEKANADLIIW